jgi:hypothetical protein
LHVNAQLLHQRYQELVEAVERETGNLKNKAALPSDETPSNSAAAMDLQSGKESLKK